jgi:hypothetical protein
LQYSEDDDSDCDYTDTFFVGTVEANRKDYPNSWHVEANVGNKRIKMKVDTGAETNVIPWSMWKKICFDEGQNLVVKKSSVALKSFAGDKVPHRGVVTVPITVSDQSALAQVFLTEGKTVPVLGLKTLLALKIVQPGENLCVMSTTATKPSPNAEKPLTLKDVQKGYDDVFTGLGRYPGMYHVTIKENAEPTIHAPRRVAPSLQTRLKAKLMDMEKKGVIRKIEQPTDWVNSLVIVEKKDGSLRLCLDPKDLNRNIKREYLQTPRFEDVLAQLQGAKIFTILDQKDSYWQVQLDEESQLLCTFNTPFGRYAFCRLPFGIACASDALQKCAYKTFGDIPGVYLIADDMLIAAENEQQHDVILRQVLDRARSNGVRFNLQKVQFKQEQVTYLGRKLGADGVRPDPQKVAAITNMPIPKDKPAVQRLLGLVNFLHSFIPNLSTITAPLRSLLKKGTAWYWSHEHQRAVEKIKEILTAKPVLALYDANKPLSIQCDSSMSGLGACILQDNKPVAYASRALSEAETRYSNIEREMLSILFATQSFHHYIYGRAMVKVQSDHKPLESIFVKALHKASPRLQMMMLKMMKYSLEVRYTPGSKMYVADTLSRAHLPMQSSAGLETVRIHAVTESVPASSQKLQEIRSATANDSELQKLVTYVTNGWPKYQGDIANAVKPYWAIRDEIHVEEGIVFLGDRLIVPTSLRQSMLLRLHEGHLGVNKCKARAADVLYWPNINEEIQITVAKCSTCATYRRRNTKEPLIPHSVPKRPWEKLGADIFEFGGKDYLLIVDYFSKYPEVLPLPNKTAQSVINCLKIVLSRHGLCDVLIADNMPFGSYKLQEFAKEWDFQIVTSSPRYPQSNGQTEKFVGTIKSLFRKAKHEHKDPLMSLLVYRNTPISGLPYSPAQLLMSRALKDRLPRTPDMLQPAVAADGRELLKKRQQQMKNCYDKGAHHRPLPDIGDSVRIRTDDAGAKTWQPAKVIAKDATPRSYIVATDDGQLRRNSRHINKDASAANSEPSAANSEPDSSSTGPINQDSALNDSPQQISGRPVRVRKEPYWKKDYV